MNKTRLETLCNKYLPNFDPVFSFVQALKNPQSDDVENDFFVVVRPSELSDEQTRKTKKRQI